MNRRNLSIDRVGKSSRANPAPGSSTEHPSSVSTRPGPYRLLGALTTGNGTFCGEFDVLDSPRHESASPPGRSSSESDFNPSPPVSTSTSSPSHANSSAAVESASNVRLRSKIRSSLCSVASRSWLPTLALMYPRSTAVLRYPSRSEISASVENRAGSGTGYRDTASTPPLYSVGRR